MATTIKPRVIALEEHYWDKEVAATSRSIGRNQQLTWST
jgi:hypothetical protein